MYQADDPLDPFSNRTQWVLSSPITERGAESNAASSKVDVEPPWDKNPYVPTQVEKLVPIETGGCVYYVPAASPVSDISTEQTIAPSVEEFVPYARSSIPTPSQNDYSSLLNASFALLSHASPSRPISEQAIPSPPDGRDRNPDEIFACESGIATGEPSHFLPDDKDFFRHLCGFSPLSSKPEVSFNLNANLRNEYAVQKMCTLATHTPSLSSFPEPQMPTILQGKYFGFRLLDSEDNPQTVTFCGFPTVAYKALSTEDNKAYLLRRVDGFNLSNFDLVKTSVDRWSHLDAHPCIVHLRQAFATQDFPDAPGDGGCLVYVYDYYPNVITLEQAHFRSPLPEPILWRYIIQIALALTHIHSAGLAARVIHPSKILVSYRYRIRLNCVGLLEATRHDVTASIAELQSQDFVAYAQLILSLACGSLEVFSDISKSYEQIFTASSYSSDLKNFVYLLLTNAAREERSMDIHSVLQFLLPRIYHSLENSWMVEDILESELKMEMENDRLFRKVLIL
ncbi:putative PAB-dependent poly(A)-specific ribonuclease subunit [Cardiosporidium cionae]|uniref:PAB-dependent poly(A)-specific ribonuclease subunit n=1 Tax=Cardiosporidium cionae TaxID=476202 RepID=A0ABQ7J8N1_9APIC|nr:putative PAB-dependent poly(A)-specific ribonuclease subunit [Cardiosporidium cionae]|eukprot:KAF8820358.1 putative PAB-dependent poly(A)-specific ribonuclease subunit [Cardiosporidium cionae]